ncbi:hypothetical protein [Microcoleus sp. FACHB-SPT15]|uniref:hypothetical protein n=1 Tax=Microcoleus sp. FACHB-SPT15 TaxID=2692830 RepID=UPI001F553B7A|nr:hypothetical protein [Microcoleus sp. FACHB-SPT15]
MNQQKISSWEIIAKNPVVIHASQPKSLNDSVTPDTEDGSGEPPEPPRKRPPFSGGFWFNDELISLNDLRIVNSRRRNGLILYKRYHAEFAGPGAAVGGEFDWDCQGVLPLGNLLLDSPGSADERQRAYMIRRQWIRLTRQITDNPVPVQRAQLILNQFEQYFDSETMAQLPDEALALLVGVLPQTITMARYSVESLDEIV